MAEKNPPLYLQQRTDHTAEGDRALITSLVENEGVAASGALAVAQSSTPAMSVQVAAGRGYVQGDDNGSQGMYHVWNDAAKTLTIAAADATNPRRDIVVARVYDAYYAGATNAFALEVITGTAAASPSDPTIPNNCLPLARVAVAASATSITNANITDLRVRAYTNGHWNTAWGEVAYAGATTSQGSISAETDITGLSVTWDAVADRKYEILVRVPVFDVTSAGTAAVFINDGSGTRYGQGNVTLGAGESTNFTVTSRYVASSSGSVTRKARVIATGGGGVITSSTDVPSYISVKDIGPS